jgi:hypothetical protein
MYYWLIVGSNPGKFLPAIEIMQEEAYRLYLPLPNTALSVRAVIIIPTRRREGEIRKGGIWRGRDYPGQGEIEKWRLKGLLLLLLLFFF